MSSSRWDALQSPNKKKNDNNNDAFSDFRREGRGKAQERGRGGRGREGRGTNRHRNTTNNRGDWKMPAKGGRHRNSSEIDCNSSWRNDAAMLNNSNQDTQVASTSSIEWDKLTKQLWDWGKHSQARGENKDVIVQEDATKIMVLLANITNTTRGRTITGHQRATAIAAALHTLAFQEDDNTVLDEILDWSCQLFAQSGRNHHDVLSLTTALQGQNCLTGLLRIPARHLDNCNGTRRTKYYECCFQVLQWFAPQLPAEITSNQMVGPVLVAALEQYLSTGNNSHNREQTTDSSTKQKSVDNKDEKEQKRLFLLGIRSLQSLLGVKKHASALLAPLVDYVDADGQEVYLVNPLRKRMFHVLQAGLFCPAVDVAEQIYPCLTTALHVAGDVDKSNKQQLPMRPKKSADLDLHVMEKFFRDILPTDHVAESNDRTSPGHRSKGTTKVLELLLAYLEQQPDASLSLVPVLLFQDNRMGTSKRADDSSFDNADKVTQCPHCKSHTRSTFLSMLHRSQSTEEVTLMMSSLAITGSNAPWKLWLGKQGLPTQRHRHFRVSNFATRVLAAINNLILVTQCCLLKHWDSLYTRQSNTLADALASLLRAALLEIPWECFDDGSNADDDRKGVMKAACNLVETVATNLLNVAPLRLSSYERIADLMEDSMGGRITPQGLRTSMIVPTAKWLPSSSSQFFLDGLLQRIAEAARMNSEEGTSQSKLPVKLLRSILRNRPQTVLEKLDYWEQFRDATHVLCASDNTVFQQNGLLMLEGLLQGRKFIFNETGVTCDSYKAAHFALSLLPVSLKIASAPCRCLCFQAYGSLLESDLLTQTKENDDLNAKSHTDLILGHCCGMEPTASVRAAACKSIGDICNTFAENENAASLPSAEVPFKSCMHQRAEFLGAICHDVCRTMLTASLDGNAAVRSMVSNPLQMQFIFVQKRISRNHSPILSFEQRQSLPPEIWLR